MNRMPGVLIKKGDSNDLEIIISRNGYSLMASREAIFQTSY